MKKFSVLLLAIFFTTACSEDDNDDNQNNNNNQNQESSFTLTSDDNSIDISGNAFLNPSFVDSVISITMTDGNNNSEASLALFHEGNVWNVNQFKLEGDTTNVETIFLLSVSPDSASTPYTAVRGEVNITDKEKNSYITGNLDVLLVNMQQGDSVNATGSFHANRNF